MLKPLRPGAARSRHADAAGSSEGLPFDAAAFESRLAWILGSPRTGSTWLLRMLVHPWALWDRGAGVRRTMSAGATGPPPVVPINESHLPVHLTPLRKPEGDWISESSSEAFLHNTGLVGRPAYFFNDRYADAWRPEVRRLILARFWAQAGRVGAAGSPVVIKEPNGSHGAPLLMSLLPRARLIFLMRDGRDVVDSQLALRLPGGARGEGRRTITDPAKRRRHIQRNSRLWVQRMDAVASAYERHDPELRYRVRYEDLRSDPFEQVRSLLRWLRVKRTDDQVRAAVDAEAFDAIPAAKKGFGSGLREARPGAWRENLTEDERQVAEEIMGSTLTGLGYLP